jgi:hypothetical protein
VAVTVSDPNNTAVSKRKEQVQKFAKVTAGSEADAIKKASAHFKKAGFKIHGAEHHSMVKEDADQIDEISQKLAGNYYGAATKKHIDKVGVKPNMYDRIEKDMGKQRKAGVDRALDRVTGARKTNEEVDISEDIKKEYDSLKKNHDIKSLRGLIQTQHKIIDTSEFKTKDHAISHYLRTKHGNKKVAAAFGLKEDFETIEEHIEKVKGGYEVESEHGNKNLGKSPTLAGAKKRLKQIEYFKHVKESKLNPADPHTDYREKKKTLQDLSRNKDVDQKVVQQRHLELDKEYSKLNNQGNIYSVMPKFDDIKEEDFYDEIDSLSLLEDILEVYGDNELAIIDSETGEQLDEEGFQEELTEAISRIERMRRRQRWARSKSKREVKEKIALRKTSSVPVLTKRAKRLATLMVKKRILRKDPSSASVQEKERAEKFLHTRPQLIQRLARRLVPRMRQVEKARLHHHKYTQSSVGTGTSASYSAH